MKRNIFAIFLCLVLVFACAGTASAFAPRVVDNAGILSGDEIAELEYQAIELTNRYNMDVVILIENGLDGMSARDYADDFYDAMDYGVGNDDSGFVLLMDMESRDWWISTEGRAIVALTDFGIQELFGSAAPYFGDDDWYHGFLAYLEAIPYYLDAYESGTPVDVIAGEKEGGISWLGIVIALGVGLVIGGVSVGAMKSSMDTTDNQRSAADYLQSDSYHLVVNHDTFLYSEVHRSAKPKDTDSDSGGSSTHTSSSGDTHGGGGGSF